jgi:uracil-DNA glycosylase
MNKHLAMAVRDPGCEKCKLHADAEQVCVVASGKKSRVMIVTKTPLAATSKASMRRRSCGRLRSSATRGVPSRRRVS